MNMIKEEYIEVIGHPRNRKHYEALGYKVRSKVPFKVKAKDVMSYNN